MYLPILALLCLLIPQTLANRCHQGRDSIGCPTAMSTEVFTTAIADFCNNRFIVPNAEPKIVSINMGTSWTPGYSLPTYEDHWGNMVSFWPNFRVDRTSSGAAYVLDYANCISLLGQASTGNGTDGGWGPNCQYTDGTSFGGWGNTDFGTAFAEAICPSGISCVPWEIRPLGC